MNRIGRAGLLVLLGMITASLLWTGEFGSFVQQRMFYPLVAAAIVLVVFGLYELVTGTLEALRSPETQRVSVGPLVGWMLMLPLLVLMAVAPTDLGAAAADRAEAFTPAQTTSKYPPLDDSAGPVEMRVYDFVDRAIWDTDESLAGVTVRLEGLVVNDLDAPDGFDLTRFMVSCCAADGVPLQVRLHGTGEPLPDDTWVVVDVTWRQPEVPYRESSGDAVIEADTVALTVMPEAPDDPYESPY